jgi:chemotaxis family two-component system response regulator Rcp1
MPNEPGRTHTILLAEDSPHDARSAHEASREGGTRHRLSIVGDGAEALAFLRRQGEYTAAPRPDLILLDLNLPHADSSEVLVEIKADPGLRGIPVVVIGTPANAREVRRCYELGANCYLTKPDAPDRFLAMLAAIHSFWLNVVTLPGSSTDAH